MKTATADVLVIGAGPAGLMAAVRAGDLGARGASNFLSKSTAVLAAAFFATSLALTYFSTSSSTGGVTESLAVPAGKIDAAPAAPAPSAPAPAGAPSGKSTEIPK